MWITAGSDRGRRSERPRSPSECVVGIGREQTLRRQADPRAAPPARPTPRRMRGTGDAGRAECSPRNRARRRPRRPRRRCTSRRRRRAWARGRAHASVGLPRARAVRSHRRSVERDRAQSSACGDRAAPAQRPHVRVRPTLLRPPPPPHRPGAAAPRSRILPAGAPGRPRSETRPRRRGVVRRGRRRPRTVSASCAASAD